jgi:hypothetical protein
MVMFLTTSIIKEINDGFHYKTLDEKYFIKVLGYEDRQIPEILIDSIKNCLNDISQLFDVRGGFKIIEDEIVKIDKDSLIIDNARFNTGRIITNNLQGSQTIGIIVGTVGEKISEYIQNLIQNNDGLGGYIADQIASEYIEYWIDIIEDRLESFLANENLKITNRYSPGYCGWDVSDQHNLFSLLPNKFCGITLTRSALMYPLKSVSAIVGIGPNVEKKDYQCKICDVDFCYKRSRDE